MNNCNNYIVTIGRCNGTRERDECSCGGDKSKCDFYPENRESKGYKATTLIVDDISTIYQLEQKISKLEKSNRNWRRKCQRLRQQLRDIQK